MKRAAGIAAACLALMTVIACSGGEKSSPAAGGSAAKPAGSDAKSIVDQAIASYSKMKSYQAEGKSETVMGDKPGGMKIESSFSIKLARPHLYVVAWKGLMNQSGGVWNAGDGPFLYMGMPGMQNAYSKMESDDMALGAATGISGGAANTIPSLFFPSPASGGVMRIMTDLKIEGSETLDGEDCHVIGGKSPVSVKHTLWISKKRSLLLKSSYSLERPADTPALPEMDDAAIDASLKAMGKTPSEEERKKMREMMEGAMKMTKDLKGTSSETHSNIVIDADLGKEAFAFKLPEGAELKESIF